jgi:hypothetical protein
MAPLPTSFVTFTLDQRQMYSPVGLRALFGQETALKLTETELLRLLGGATRSDMKEWKRAATAKEAITLPNDTLNRVRGALVVFQAVLQRFPKSHDRAAEWLRKPHPAFDKKAPLTAMMDSNPEGLLSVVRYVKIQNTLPDPKKATAKPIRRKRSENA